MMEENIFHTPEVSGELLKVVEARLHTDRESEFLDQILKLQRDYTGTVSLPIYVIIDPATGTVLGEWRKGLTGAAKFADFVRRAVGASVD